MSAPTSGVARLWTASTASSAADGLLITGAPLLVVSISREPLALSTLNALWFLPWLLFGLLVGALIDRLDRRSAMVWGAGVRAAAGVALAVVALGHGSLPLVYVVVFAFSTAEILYDTAARALLPSLVEARRLEAMNSRLVSAELIAQGFVGPLLAGLLFAAAAPAPFAAMAVLLVVAALAVGSLRGSYRPPPDDQPRRSMAKEIAEGTRWLFSHPVLRNIAVLVGILGFLGSGVTALIVLYAQDELGLSERMVGVLLAAGALGSVTGSMVAPRAGRLFGRGRALALAVSLIGVAAIGLALTRRPAVAMALLGLSSVGTMGWNVITLALRQALIPDRLLGRAFAAYRLLALGSVPLGATAAGLVATWTDLQTVFMSAGVLHLVAAVAFARPLMAAGREFEAATAVRPTEPQEA